MSSAQRKTLSKWESKKWYTLIAPRAFGYTELGKAPADSEKQLMGRTIEISFYDITKDISQLPVKLRFQVVKVEGDKAYTQLKRMELTVDYIRSLVRRGTSKIDAVVDVTTKDGVNLRVAGMTVTESRVKTSQKKAIRKILVGTILEKAEQLTFEEFVQEAVLGMLAAEIETRARKIYPVRKAEIRKIKVLSSIPEIQLTAPAQSE